MARAHPPVQIDGYRILDQIGIGGFSVVYRAEQLSMDRHVAIKVLNSGFETEREQRAFQRELRALGRLSHHPHIVTVFNDTVTSDGRPCIVMELYSTTYRQVLAAHKVVPIGEIVDNGVRIAEALHVAHQHGVLHRDIKPHNIFISRYGEAALGDFGISTLDEERSRSGSSGLSVAYAAPEVLEDGETSRASDVYSLGATLYHLVTGSRPFESADMRATMKRIISDLPGPITRPDCPPALAALLHQAMAKVPEERPESARQLAVRLRDVHRPADGDASSPPRILTAAPIVVTPSAPDAATLTGVPAPPDSEVTDVTVARRQRPAAPDAPEPGTRSRRQLALVAAGTIVLAAAGIGTAVLLAGDGGEEPEEPPPAATTGAATTPSTRPPDTAPGDAVDVGAVELADGADIGIDADHEELIEEFGVEGLPYPAAAESSLMDFRVDVSESGERADEVSVVLTSEWEAAEIVAALRAEVRRTGEYDITDSTSPTSVGFEASPTRFEDELPVWTALITEVEGNEGSYQVEIERRTSYDDGDTTPPAAVTDVMADAERVASGLGYPRRDWSYWLAVNIIDPTIHTEYVEYSLTIPQDRVDRVTDRIAGQLGTVTDRVDEGDYTTFTGAGFDWMVMDSGTLLITAERDA